MRYLRDFLRNITPYQILVFGYILVTVTGAILLSLPISSAQGKHQLFIDALFIAASGISTTGLATVDIGSSYNIFGQIVLLCIFQIGGIGYMTFIVFFANILDMRLPVTANTVAKESLSGPDYKTLGHFFFVTFLFTVIFELAGTIILTLFWSKEFPFAKALYLGSFHSVSAFCTAGFSVFPDSFMKYKYNILVNFTIIAISIAGGLGFKVLHKLYVFAKKKIKNEYRGRLSLHTKIVLIVTCAVMFCGIVIILFAEKWPQTDTLFDRIMTSTFQAVSASTTDGFNTIDIGLMSAPSLTSIMALMFIGASPGSTGGGIKTTTLGLLIIFLWSQLKGRKKPLTSSNGKYR